MAIHIHLDPVGGAAGDMFVAAMLDAFPRHRAGVLAAVRAAGLPPRIACCVMGHRDHALTGNRFVVDMRREPHDDDHGHTPFRTIKGRLARARLSPGVRGRALAIFGLLAEVEGKVHGIAPEKVSFHELGGWDSIADIVAAAYLIDAMGPASWSVGPLPLGSGRVRSAHGLLPVPAPATALLLQGFAAMADGIGGERVTPTGAAILKHLGCASGMGAGARRLAGTGIGFGTRKLPGISNVLRVLAFSDVASGDWQTDRVTQIEFEVDDQTPEDLAVGLDHIRAVDGVLDAVQSPVLGKKGRIAIAVRVLCAPERRDAVIAACFHETTTIGLRMQTVERAILPRDVATAPGGLRVKRVTRPGGRVTAKTEIDGVSGKSGAVERDEARRAAAAVSAGASGRRRRR